MSVKSTLPRSEVGSQNPYPDPPRQAGEGKPVEAPVAGRDVLERLAAMAPHAAGD